MPYYKLSKCPSFSQNETPTYSTILVGPLRFRKRPLQSSMLCPWAITTYCAMRGSRGDVQALLPENISANVFLDIDIEDLF